MLVKAALRLGVKQTAYPIPMPSPCFLRVYAQGFSHRRYIGLELVQKPLLKKSELSGCFYPFCMERVRVAIGLPPPFVLPTATEEVQVNRFPFQGKALELQGVAKTIQDNVLALIHRRWNQLRQLFESNADALPLLLHFFTAKRSTISSGKNIANKSFRVSCVSIPKGTNSSPTPQNNI